MKFDDKWPDRVYVEISQYEKMHGLYSKSSDGIINLPFKSLKEVILASAIIGYNHHRREKLENKKEIIFTRYMDSSIDLPIVICIAIFENYGDVDIIKNKKEIIEIFQEFIKGGFDILYDTIKGGGDEIQNYARYLLENYSEN